MLKNLYMYMIGITPKKNSELHIVRQSQICCPATPKAAPTCKRKQWSEETVTGAVNKLKKETLYTANLLRGKLLQ